MEEKSTKLFLTKLKTGKKRTKTFVFFPLYIRINMNISEKQILKTMFIQINEKENVYSGNNYYNYKII